jgi:hypothetical protein
MEKNKSHRRIDKQVRIEKENSKMAGITTYLPIIPLNVNDLHNSIDRHRMVSYI